MAGAEEGEISDLAESIHFDNLAPERGNDGSYHNNYCIHRSVVISMVADELLKARNKKSEASIDSAKLIHNLIDTIAILGNVNYFLMSTQFAQI